MKLASFRLKPTGWIHVQNDRHSLGAEVFGRCGDVLSWHNLGIDFFLSDGYYEKFSISVVQISVQHVNVHIKAFMPKTKCARMEAPTQSSATGHESPEPEGAIEPLKPPAY
jgi:hypothetical protein